MEKTESDSPENPNQHAVIAAAELVIDRALPFEKARRIAARIGKCMILGLAANGVAFGGLALVPYLQPQSAESESD